MPETYDRATAAGCLTQHGNATYGSTVEPYLPTCFRRANIGPCQSNQTETALVVARGTRCRFGRFHPGANGWRRAECINALHFATALVPHDEGSCIGANAFVKELKHIAQRPSGAVAAGPNDLLAHGPVCRAYGVTQGCCRRPKRIRYSLGRHRAVVPGKVETTKYTTVRRRNRYADDRTHAHLGHFPMEQVGTWGWRGDRATLRKRKVRKRNPRYETLLLRKRRSIGSHAGSEQQSLAVEIGEKQFATIRPRCDSDQIKYRISAIRHVFGENCAGETGHDVKVNARTGRVPALRTPHELPAKRQLYRRDHAYVGGIACGGAGLGPAAGGWTRLKTLYGFALLVRACSATQHVPAVPTLRRFAIAGYTPVDLPVLIYQ